jgi:rSAM/selenodomain-associated transferase 1
VAAARPGRRLSARVGSSAALVLFARVPRLGRVKTRLARRIGSEAALLLHQALLADALLFTRRAARTSGAKALVAWDTAWPPGASRSLANAARHLEPIRQGRGDLGARMRRVVRGLVARGVERLVLIGSDSPTAPRRAVSRAFRLLREGADIVLGPAEDGGYWLLGVRADRPEIFAGIPWGTRRVLRRTAERAAARGARVRFVGTSWDVDRPRDLLRLRRVLRGAGARRAPRTAAALRHLSRCGWFRGGRPSGGRRAP